jgi:putative ABC transport system permease protein
VKLVSNRSLEDPPMNLLVETCRQALRSLLRNPVFSLLAVGALAVAIGGSTLLLSLYDSIALRDLPVSRPHELVSVREILVDDAGRSANYGRVSLADFEELRLAANPLAELGAEAVGEAILRVGEQSRRVDAAWVDAGYFDLLGVTPRLGRTFRSDDDPRRGGAGGIVLGERAWARELGSDPGIVGRTIELDGAPVTVLGVAPRGFRGFEVGSEPALFALAAQAPPNWAFFRLFGRLRDGSSAARLEGLLAGVHAEIRARQPDRRRFLILDGQSAEAAEQIRVVPGRRGESDLRGNASRALLLAGGMLLLVLLVLAANLANLLAVQALRERGEAAIRLALGAPRSWLAATWVARCLLLTTTGGALGTLLAAASAESLLAFAPLPPWIRGLTFAIDLRSAALAALLALATALAIGGLAIWEHSRLAPSSRLREESAATTLSRAALRWRDALISFQVALSVVLLVATGLFVRSVDRLLAIDTGMPLDRVLSVTLDYPTTATAEAAAAFRRLREAVAALPGVESVGLTGNPVLGGVTAFRVGLIEGYAPEQGRPPMLNFVSVTPGLLETLDLPVASGRYLTMGDEKRVVVNRQFARHYFGGDDPVGRRLYFGMNRGAWSEPNENDVHIVGMVDDRMIGYVQEKPTPRVYLLFDGNESTATLHVRTAGPPASLRTGVERLLRELAPGAALGPLRTLAEQRDRSLGRDILMRDLGVVFGASSALLAALGLFAVLAYAVRGRRRELGLRQALGARPADLERLVFADGLRPLLAGLALGLGIAAVAGRYAESLLFGVSARDPSAYVGATVVMILVGCAAALPAARRAARVEPAAALRSE